jgi:hypothetical protein
MPANPLNLGPQRPRRQARQLGAELALLLSEVLEHGPAARLETSIVTTLLRCCLSSKTKLKRSILGV